MLMHTRLRFARKIEHDECIKLAIKTTRFRALSANYRLF